LCNRQADLSRFEEHCKAQAFWLCSNKIIFLNLSKFALDSWAVIAWLENVAPAANRVEKIFRYRPIISTVNVAEIYYVVKRKRDVATAQKVINQLRVRAQFVEANEQVAIMAGEIKSENKMALGDAFAVATANLHGATLLTGDPEILSARTKWKLLDLR
jgi:uncharacterized protein